MKKIWSLLMAAALLLSLAGTAAADMTTIQPDMEMEVSREYGDSLPMLNPEIEGISPLTGLPMEEEYTPITLVLDDSPEVFPHWGVAEADWIVQVPLRRSRPAASGAPG